ncbi:hypothetical protein STEG23_032721, partial [Scotinomys teguina]
NKIKANVPKYPTDNSSHGPLLFSSTLYQQSVEMNNLVLYQEPVLEEWWKITSINTASDQMHISPKAFQLQCDPETGLELRKPGADQTLGLMTKHHEFK